MNENLRIARQLVRIANELAYQPNVVYSAILIDEPDQARILEDSVHPCKYGEHVTLYFHGNDDTYDAPFAGRRVKVKLLRHYSDDHGEAWTVECNDKDVQAIKDPGQRLHVTVSCNDAGPVYSNTLIRTAEPDDREGFTVNGVIAYMTDDGWVTTELEEQGI